MNIDINDNSQQVLKDLDAQVEKALTAVGIHLEGEAKDELENKPRRVDTGRLKGSITYATSTNHSVGQKPSSPPDYDTRERPEKGALYVGTNVEYAAYVHEGTQRMLANRYLKNAFERNESQVKNYIKRELEGK